MSRSSVVRLVLFGYLWGTIGFFAGTLTLLGPVRWVTAALRARSGAQAAEDLAVRAIILALLVVTGLIAWRLSRRAQKTDGSVRWAMPATTTALAAVAMMSWMNPRLVNRGAGDVDASDAQFVFGPYPDEARLRELKARGFTGVISLLHPAVVPFEPRLLGQERAAAQAVGIALIHTPMLPWISENEESASRIREIARSREGRYYIHCYLGKDRVNVVRRLLEDENVTLDKAKAEEGARRIADMPAFERGSIYHFGDTVHVAPLPTDEEWVGYVLAGSVKTVLSLLDPGNREDSVWIAKERALAAQYRIRVEFAPIAAFPFDPAQAVAAASRARALGRPLMVHAFRTDSPITEAFVQAWRSGLPPLPPALFREPMRAGAVRVIGVNVAAGPRPEGPDFGSYLHRRGVRGIIFIGAADNAARSDRSIATSAGLTWQSVLAGGPELDRILSSGGPWYLYGPGLDAARVALETRLDPGVPGG